MDYFKIILIFVFVRQCLCIACSQCDSDTDSACIDDPPSPQNCTLCAEYDIQTRQCVAHQTTQYCVIERRYFNDTLIRITRDCFPAMMRDICKVVDEHDELIKVCYSTCRTIGCNMNGGWSLAFDHAILFTVFGHIFFKDWTLT